MKTGLYAILTFLMSLGFAGETLYAQEFTAQENGVIPVLYAEETELLGVVCHLAGIGGYDFSEEEEGVLPDYLSDVESHFAASKDHKAVRFARKQLYRKGFSYDMPMAFALRLKIKDGHICRKDSLVADYDGYYDRLSRSDETEFISLLEDFYRESSFAEFFDSHRGLYRECEDAMRKVVDNLDIEWYDSFFGPKRDSGFRVYLGLLNGPGNYAVHQKLTDGGEIINAVMGCCDRDEEGRIYYGEVYTMPILVHEFNHSYCNPLNEEIWDSIADKAEAIFNENADFYGSIAYGAPEYLMNEMFVEASVIRYLMTHPIDLTGTGFEDMQSLTERLLEVDEQQKRFVLVRKMVEALGVRESSYDIYPAMRDFMPVLYRMVL